MKRSTHAPLHAALDVLAELRFQLRERTVRRHPLRRGLPRLSSPKEGELAFYSLLAESALTAGERSQVSWLWDIGCRHWSYVEALAGAFPNASLRGIELDGGRLYPDLYRRMDHASARAAELQARLGRPVECQFKDFLKITESEPPSSPDPERPRQEQPAGLWLFTFFYPFVSERPCRKWGLPSRFADFEAQLQKARELAASKGTPAVALSVHQGKWEEELALASFRRCGMTPRAHCVAPDLWSGLWPVQHPAQILVSRF